MRRASSVKRANPANRAGSFSLAYLFPHVGDTMSDHGTILIPAELNSKGEKYSFRSVNAFGSVHEQFGVWIKAVPKSKEPLQIETGVPNWFIRRAYGDFEVWTGPKMYSR